MDKVDKVDKEEELPELKNLIINEENKKNEKNNETLPELKSFLNKNLKSDMEITFNELFESYIKLIEEKTKLKRIIIYVILFISFFCFLIGRYEIFFSFLLTAVFPIKWTYEEYKSKNEDFIKMWGSYWLVFSVFTILDIFHKTIIILVPFYFFVRTIILFWLYLPCFKGAITLYHFGFVDIFKFYYTYNGQYDEKNSMLAEYKNKIKAKIE